MSDYKRLPRKLKKQLKKNSQKWKEYLEERKTVRERSENLDIIFTRNFEHSHKIFQKIIRTGKL